VSAADQKRLESACRFGLVGPGTFAIRLREKSNFASRSNLIWAVQSLAQKYCSFVFSEIVIDYLYSAPTQGTYRDRHERGAGCGGRRLCRLTSGAEADGEVVWSWRAHAGAKRVTMRSASHG
jgi:hypothetical protein